jgi:ion channel-forming bestrophin family protein
MLVKRNLNPLKVFLYVWRPTTYACGVAVAVLGLRLAWPDARWYMLPFAPVGALAAALAIVVAFRANAAYQRWWEARTLWQNIANNSRIFGRQVLASTRDAISAGKGGEEQDVLDYQREITLRVVAFAYALRDSLRATDGTAELCRLLSPAEYARVCAAHNRPNALLTGIGVMVKQGVRAERIGMFDPIVLEPNLAALNNWAGGTERIRNTPIPRQYSFFSRAFIFTLATLLPFGLVGLLTDDLLWWLVPLSTVGAGLFILLERTSEANDTPFANAVTDVPMTAICVDIERDLRAQMDDADLPQALVPVAGYLW